MPNQHQNGARPRVAAAVPTAQKQALEHIAAERSAPGDQTSNAQIIRESVELLLAAQKATGEIPAEALSNVEAIDAAEVLEEHGLTVRNGSIEKTDSDGVEA